MPLSPEEINELRSRQQAADRARKEEQLATERAQQEAAEAAVREQEAESAHATLKQEYDADIQERHQLGQDLQEAGYKTQEHQAAQRELEQLDTELGEAETRLQSARAMSLERTAELHQVILDLNITDDQLANPELLIPEIREILATAEQGVRNVREVEERIENEVVDLRKKKPALEGYPQAFGDTYQRVEAKEREIDAKNLLGSSERLRDEVHQEALDEYAPIQEARKKEAKVQADWDLAKQMAPGQEHRLETNKVELAKVVENAKFLLGQALPDSQRGGVDKVQIEAVGKVVEKLIQDRIAIASSHSINDKAVDLEGLQWGMRASFGEFHNVLEKARRGFSSDSRDFNDQMLRAHTEAVAVGTVVRKLLGMGGTPEYFATDLAKAASIDKVTVSPYSPRREEEETTVEKQSVRKYLSTINTVAAAQAAGLIASRQNRTTDNLGRVGLLVQAGGAIIPVEASPAERQRFGDNYVIQVEEFRQLRLNALKEKIQELESQIGSADQLMAAWKAGKAMMESGKRAELEKERANLEKNVPEYEKELSRVEAAILNDEEIERLVGLVGVFKRRGRRQELEDGNTRNTRRISELQGLLEAARKRSPELDSELAEVIAIESKYRDLGMGLGRSETLENRIRSREEDQEKRRAQLIELQKEAEGLEKLVSPEN